MVIGVDMVWMQYLMEEDFVVKVVCCDGGDVDLENVIIRLIIFDFKLLIDGKVLFIDVLFSKIGYCFLVEFKDNFWEYCNVVLGLRQGYVQNVDFNGESYVEVFDDSMFIVGVELINVFFVFVSFFLVDEYVFDLSEDIYEVFQGLVIGFDKVIELKVYFLLGVYWFIGFIYVIFLESVIWVYIVLGVYVKGVIEYCSQVFYFKVIGFGVLFGE